MSRFSVAHPAFRGFSIEPGRSDVMTGINVLIDGQPPPPSERFPGITLHARNEEELRALWDWVVSRLDSQGIGQCFPAAGIHSPQNCRCPIEGAAGSGAS